MPLSSAIHTPSSSPIRKFDSPTHQPKKARIHSPQSKPVKVESYPRLYLSGSKIEGKSERLQHGTDYAHDLDKTTSLDPANSTVERHTLITIDCSPSSVYLHTNSKQYLNELLVTEEQEEIQEAVMSVFLECLYGAVGFIPWYQREREEYEIPYPKVNVDAER